MPIKKKKRAIKKKEAADAASRSKLEVEFENQLYTNYVGKFVTEFPFAKPFRKWRLDFAWPDAKFGIEIQGGTWRGGRHTRGKGFESDTEKRNFATMNGWRVLEFTSRMVKSGEAIRLTKAYLEDRRSRQY